MDKDKKIKNVNAHYRGINRILCTISLASLGIILIVYLFKFIFMIKQPPPDIEDIKTLLAILLPLFTLLIGGVISGLTYGYYKTHKEQDNKNADLL